MKRTFLRILPLAVAVLLATSCSKDENNDNAVVNNGQGNVQTRTMPISITVNQKGLSKLGCTGAIGEDLQPIFETSDKLAIYNGGTFLTELAIKDGTISQDGKTATFEGEITAEEIVDGETILTATIGTQITEAQTASSREGAVKTGCYQTAEFTYSSEGNKIQLEEQNAYIEVVWKNKGGEAVDFTFGSETVTLYLNDEGQGWIVVPAGKSFTCAALGLTTANTTAKGNIYGITRKFVPDGYVDLGVVLDDGTEVYFSSEASTDVTWQAEEYWPTIEEFVNLKSDCYWVWDNTENHNGYYVFKTHAEADKGQITNSNSSYSPSTPYSIESDPYIFLPVTYKNFGYYWSGEDEINNYGDRLALSFGSNNVSPNGAWPGPTAGVVTVQRSN